MENQNVKDDKKSQHLKFLKSIETDDREMLAHMNEMIENSWSKTKKKYTKLKSGWYRSLCRAPNRRDAKDHHGSSSSHIETYTCHANIGGL